MPAQEPTTFDASEGMAVFDDETRSYWVSQTTPENTFSTNVLDKWKLQDDGTVVAKSRSVLVGWKDPMVYRLERVAPTPTQEGIMVTLLWLASAKVSGRISDSTNAFGQARKTLRKNKLATKMPHSVTHPAVGPRQLLLVETEIYGLVSGPSWLRASLTVDLLAAGYVKNPYDKCLFTLFSSDDITAGQLLLDVDDFIEGGKEAHRKAMEGFMPSTIVVRRSTSCQQDKGAHCSL